MNSKEEIKAAVAKKFKTKDVDLGNGIKVTVRELSRGEHNALNRRLYECDAAGVPVARDGQYTPRKDVDACHEWLAATLVPVHTVQDLEDDSWPESLKLDLYREALKLNGFTVKDAVGN